MDIINDDPKYLNKLFDNVYSYPSITDKDFQEKIFRKKEFFNYQVQKSKDIKNYEDLEEYRKNAVSQFKLAEYQQMLANYFNPDTPFNSLLLFHGLGTGKTCCAINIASRFYNQIKKYNTRIYVLVPGPILKENWMNEIRNSKCSGLANVTDKQIFEYYNILSYKAFNKRVLGEKIRNKDFKDNKLSKYKKNDEGEIMRNESYNKIHSLDNTLLIVDEAHNITGNDWTNAVKKICAVSKNLKLLLLTGTPMKNAADDIISLIEIMNIANHNYDKLPQIFTGNNHTLDFVNGGEKILREQLKGKFSFISGGDKYLFAVRNDIGIIPDSLKFTRIVPVEFNKEQYEFYKSVTDQYDNGLEEHSRDVCNFILPNIVYNDKKGYIEMVYGKKGLDEVISNIKTNNKDFNLALKEFINKRSDKKVKNENDLIYLSGNSITGQFLKRDYLKLFSPKFHKALSNIESLIEGKKGPKTAFIYSNLVTLGINLFKQVLIQNGFVEFIENKEKTINSANDNTVCYYCGKKKIEHDKVHSHVYYPASFIVITGDSDDEVIEDEKKKQRRIVEEVFSSNENKEGKYIKLILGSKVISEGYNTKNIMEVHILDVYYNFARVDQVVGRAIRKNSHRFLYSKDNPYPVVDVYKYCMVNKVPTNEELLYQKAEKKHVMIKYVEHIIKQEAIDKYLTYQLNNKKINKCVPLLHGNKYDSQVLSAKEKENVCSAENDYLDKSYLTKEDKELIDKVNNNKSLVDTNTFTNNMIKYEIDKCKEIIKSMFLFKYAYVLDDIIKFVKDSYDSSFDIYYVYKALDELVPTNDNDFNNMDDNIIRDKFNKIGYLIYINNYYIFQPYNQPINIPMYYRTTKQQVTPINNSLLTYLTDNNIIDESINQVNEKEYDFVSVSDYYNNRKQNDIIGIIDKEPNVKGNKRFSELNDTFKIRDKITIKTTLKRKSGLQTYTGAVCYNAYQYNDLVKKLNKMGIKLSKEEDNKKSRVLVCNKLKEVLMKLEKYSEDNTTYCIIPLNHPIYEFPYNLKDRCKYIVNKISERFNVNINVEKVKEIRGYKISCNDGKDIEKDFMLENKFELNGKSWIRIIN